MPFDSQWCCGKNLKGDAQNLRQRILANKNIENRFHYYNIVYLIVDLIKCNVEFIAN